MADEQITTDTTAPVATALTNPPPVTPPAPVAKTFTQEEVDSIVRDRLARAAKPAAPVAAPAPKPAASAPAAQSESISVADVQRMIAREGALQRAIGAAGLEPEQEASVRAFYDAAQPADVSSWWSTTIAPLKLGKSPAPPAATTPAALAAPTAPTAPVIPNPPVAPSAPNGASLPKQNGVVDLFALTDEQRKSLGPAGVKAALESLVNIGNQQAGMPTRPKPPAQR